LARKTNFSFEKRRKELDKKKKKEAKLARKQEKKEDGYTAPDPLAGIVPGPQPRAGFGDEGDPLLDSVDADDDADDDDED